MNIINSRKQKHRKQILFFVFLWLICFLAILPASSQTVKDKNITLKTQNESLVSILNKISALTNYKFFYDQETADKAPRVSIDAKNATIQSVLKQIAAQTHLYFHKTNNTISVSKTPPALPQEADRVITTKIVTGNITDEKGEPIIGANVIEKGTISNGTVTDVDGNFSLKVTSDAVLQISYIGYLSQEVETAGTTTFTVILQEDTKSLDELVVVGYGTMKKSDLTGAISSVKANELPLTGNVSVIHAISGKVSGLYTRQNSAQPGGGIDILIRGAGSVNASNRPLYIVDGFPISNVEEMQTGDAKMNPGTQGVLNFLNPNDIESIEVLKDASASSIYGARAANGVILITTKKGAKGRAVVSYSGQYSFQKYTDRYDLLPLNEWMEVKNASTYEEWLRVNEVTPWGGKTLEEVMKTPTNGDYVKPYSDTDIANAGAGTDWLGLITRNGQINEHNLNVRGGSENTLYNVSFNYFDHKGIIKNTGLKRYSLKSNIDQRINSAIKIGVNLTLSRLDNDNSQLGDARSENSGIIRSAIQTGPHIAAYDETTGTYPINPLLGMLPNPYSLLNNIDKTNTDRLLANTFVEVMPVEGLQLRLNTGIDRVAISRSTYQPKSTLNGAKLNGVAGIYSQDNNQYLIEATANYTKLLNDIHNINFLAGTSYEKFSKRNANFGNNDFITDTFIYNNMSAGIGNKIVGSGYSETQMQSYFFRFNYVYNNRYLLNVTMRADGASVFPTNHKWGYFPSVAAGWAISQEEFLNDVNWIENLKLRASWGQTGNADIGINAYSSYMARLAYVSGNDTEQTGVFQKRLGNPNLKWETTTEFNLGLDFAFLKGRIRGSFEYYNKVISDLLNYKYLNTYHSLNQIMANVGKTQSSGIELNLNTRNIETKNFSWSTDFIFTKFKDRWKERASDWKPNIYENADDPIRPIYSRLADHIMQTGDAVPVAQPELLPGQIVIKDINGYQRDEKNKPKVDENGHFLLTGKPDGIIDDADKTLIGTTDPGWLAGFGNTFRYKNVDLNIHMNGMFDRIMMNPTYVDYGISAAGIADYGYNALRSVKDRWTFTHPSTTQPSSYATFGHDYTYGDFFYEKAWFIRIQSVSLGYSFSQRALQKLKYISNLRFHVNANNLYTFTPYSGIDPETDSYAAAYPNARTFSFGIEVQF